MRTMILSAALGLACGAAVADQPARGVVFHDENRNGRRDPGEPGIGDVCVSNGRDVVRTDGDGRYRLDVDDDSMIFIRKPAGWMTPVSEQQLPRFYHVHKPGGSPAGLKYAGVAPTGPLPDAVNFPLYRHDEPEQFKVVLFGDPQPYTLQEVDYLAHDIVEQLVGADAALGISLGDLVGDNLDLFEPYVRAVAHVGVPWYNVLGNHDMNYRAADDRHADESFERVFGPPYYSFDYGKVHFVVLDDVIWEGEQGAKKGRYYPGLGARQLAWLKNDLASVTGGERVVLLMHIPMTEWQEPERSAILAALAEHEHTLSFSAHWHMQRHYFLGAAEGWTGPSPHHHLVHATTSGSWWRGAPDETGVPHTTMRDGAPNGWSLVTFAGADQYTIDFFPARRPRDWQMSIFLPDAIARDARAGTPVYVNVFAGSEKSSVRLKVADGPWQDLARVEEPDPFYLALKASEESKAPPNGRKLPNPEPSGHLWKGALPAIEAPGTYRITAETQDMFGRTFRSYRLVRVE